MRGWSGVTVAKAMAAPHNNFTLVRLCLALLVVMSHAVSINLGGPEPLKEATGFTLGEHAVNGFFAVSGFLVTMSYDRRHWRDYVVARLLRIGPGFVVAVLFTAAVGAAMTRLSLSDYLADPQLWRFLRTTLIGFKSANTLPAAFEGNPQAFVMAPVWTLRYEVYCYAGVLALGLLGLGRSAYGIAALALALGLGLAGLDWLRPDASLLVRTFLRLFFLFSIGASLYVMRQRAPLSVWVVAGLALAVVALRTTPAYEAALFAAEGYGALWLALAPGLTRSGWEPRADLSYGVYLYGWPIQQALRQGLAAWPFASLLLLGLLATIAAATLSWFLVEKPALAFKLRRPRGLPAAAPDGPA